MASDLNFSDVSPICSRCGCACDEGFVIVGSGMRERDTGYQDEETLCAACADEDQRYEAADQAYDFSQGG